MITVWTDQDGRLYPERVKERDCDKCGFPALCHAYLLSYRSRYYLAWYCDGCINQTGVN